MARGFALALAVVAVLGGVAALAYQAGVASVAATGTTTALATNPYVWHPFFGFGFFGLLFPLLFLFIVFALARAAFGGWGHGYDGRRRMLEEWHRDMHERHGSEAERH